MNPFFITIEGVRHGLAGTFYYVVEASTEDEAIQKVADLQDVRLLDEVHTVNGMTVHS